jgi:hypothetical protein
MKKILLLLIVFYSSSFAVSYFCGATEPSQYAGYGGAESSGSFNAYSNRSYSSWRSATGCSDRQDYWAVVPAIGSAEKYIFHHYDSYSSNRVYTRTKYTLINQPIPPTCDPSTEVDVNGVCEVIGESGTCPTPNVRLADGSCSTCTIDQHYDLQQETCVNNCVPILVTNPNPDIWIDLNQNTSDTCMNFLIDRQIDGSWLSSDDGCGGTSFGCYGQPDSPCDTLLSAVVQRPLGGFVYKEIVSNSSICSSYVDGIKYIDSRVRHIDDDCVKNDDFYCYLLPLNGDDNTTNQDNPIPDINTPDIIVSNNRINPDLNLSNPQSLNNQILQDLKNNLQDQSLDTKDYHVWVKNKFGKWEPQSNAEKQLNEQKLTTNAITESKNNLGTKLNAINSNLGLKLDNINNSINDLNLSVSTNIDLNKTNDLLSSLVNGDSNLSSDSSFVMSYFDETYSNLFTQYDNVKGQINNAIGVFNGKGLSTVLSSSDVITTCPKNFVFNMSDSLSKNISIDPCFVLSQSREYMYTFSYIGFSAMYISFLVGIMVRV